MATKTGLIDIEDVEPKQQTNTIPENLLSDGKPITERKEQQPSQLGEVVDLPSSGVHGYPSSVPIGELMVRHESLMAKATERTIMRTYNTVVCDLIGNPEWSNRLSISDREYLLMYLWLRTFDNNIKTNEKCPHCGVHHDYDVVVNNDMIRYPDERLRQGPIIFPFEKLGKRKINLPTIATENRIEEYAQANGINFGDDYTEYERLLVAFSIDFEDPLLSLDERNVVKAAENNLTTVDKRRVLRVFEKFSYGFPNSITHKCKNADCGKSFDARFPVNISDLFGSKPEDTDEDFLLSL